MQLLHIHSTLHHMLHAACTGDSQPPHTDQSLRAFGHDLPSLQSARADIPLVVICPPIFLVRHRVYLAQRLVHIGALPAVVDDEEAGGHAALHQAAHAVVQACAHARI